MPYHNFLCENCGEEFEQWLSFNFSDKDIENIPCPRCHNHQVKKKISIPVVLFTGNGFYATDNRKVDQSE